MTEYLGMAEVLAIHEDQIDAFGGARGVRDLGLIEAALYRPQTGYYEDLVQEAAALWESFSQNHPFVDGNKRVAFAVTDTFLMVNGISIEEDPIEAYKFMMDLYETGRFNFVELEKWLRSHTRKI